MKKIIYGLVLAMVPLINTAAENEVKAYLTGDTLFYNQDYQIMPAKKIKKAVYYGVVKDIDDENIATIAVYDKKDQTLLALLKRMNSGQKKANNAIITRMERSKKQMFTLYYSMMKKTAK